MLDSETRAMLCAHCTKATYAANSKVETNFDRMFLVLEGICLITQNGNVAFFMRAGDFAIPPDLGNFTDGFPTPLEGEWRTSMQHSHYQYPTATTCATFEKDFIMSMLDKPQFLRALFGNFVEVSYQSTFYQLFVFHTSAVESVKYALQFSEQNGLKNPTHAQLALLTGRNRTTVTHAMHEIALEQGDA